MFSVEANLRLLCFISNEKSAVCSASRETNQSGKTPKRLRHLEPNAPLFFMHCVVFIHCNLTVFCCCFFVPFTGTFISAFTVLCGARSELISERGVCCVFWLNVAAALIQILTAVIMVGWIMSIFWGMDMVILASQYLSGSVCFLCSLRSFGSVRFTSLVYVSLVSFCFVCLTHDI